MKSKQITVRRVVATSLCAAMLTTNASAVVKEVALWGAKSINDLGRSDRLITMEELQDNYSGYLQTDGMTEYFHKDQSPSPKKNMTEALAWLINNNIINRDETITVSNIRGVPSVSIVKADINDKLYYSVHRSDALMYLYKAVYGELPGRTLGVETPSVRMDSGSEYLFSTILEMHRDTTDQEIEGESNAYPGNPGMPGVNGGAPGGAGGDATSDSQYTNTANQWRYTPQGDAYTSVFGDTNIFISENHFNQEATGGDGGEGGAGNGGVGGAGGDGGNADNTINYETDYKSVYFVPGSDILFYNTGDVVEMYLQALWSNGILESDSALRTTKFAEEFDQYTASNVSIAPWSGEADPFVINLSIAEHVRKENVAYTSTSNVLGANYVVRNNGSSVTLSRQNLFDSNTGYFMTEEVTRMDLYRYIYYMVYANEKKLSDLERDIVTYKYGMQFDGIANAEDTSILQYLIAKGILDYTNASELVNLYSTVTWNDFIPILYRVANENARLDFSLIQLTDSEQSWKSKGFSPQTIQLVPEGVIGELSLELDDSYTIESAGAQDTSVLSTLASLFGVTEVDAAPAEVGTLVYSLANSGAMMFGGYYFDFQGATYTSETLLSEFKAKLSAMDSLSKEDLSSESSLGLNIENPKHQIVAYMLKNIYVVSMLQTDGTLYNSMASALKEWKNTQPSSMSADVYLTKKAIAGYLENMLESARDGTGAPTSVQFVMTDGTVVTSPNSGSGVETFARNLKAIRFAMPDTSLGTRVTYTFEFVEDSAGALIAAGENVVSAVNNSAVEFTRRVTESELQDNSTVIAVEQEMANRLGTAEATPSLISAEASDGSAAIQQQVSPTGKDAFVAWSDIMTTTMPDGTALPIVKVSDGVLYNTQTDTYAYFSAETDTASAIALVGTSVVSGDATLGVMFKTGDGEAAEVYYHADAIRLLLNAQEERSVVGGVRGLAMPDENFSNHVEVIDLISESGVSESKITGLQVKISEDYAADKSKFGADSPFSYSKVVGNHVWGNYLTLSQANRVMNIVSRKISYTSTTGHESIAYAVLRFVPVDVEELGSVTITSNSSLQDLLDSPAQAPADPAAKQVWTQNKAACNAYANWIYGTSNQLYIETGYLRPVPSVYVLGDAADSMPPASMFTPLTDSQMASVSIVQMGKVTDGGVALLSEEVSEATSGYSDYRCQYWLSTDCSVVMSGDRLYLHESVFTGLALGENTDGSVYARATNISAKPASFMPGSTFKVGGVSDILANGMAQPTIMVTAITEDGTVKCQVGPITGIPVNFGTTKAVISQPGSPDAAKSLAAYDLTGNTGDNRLITTYYEMFKSMPGIKNTGIATEPVFTATSLTNHYVSTGSHVSVYESSSKPLATVALPTATSDDTMATYSERIKQAVSKYSAAHPNLTYTYLTVEFPAANYRVQDGKLYYDKSSATEFLSPSLFTSLNDLIIDQMINEANGAIPLNEVPVGSLLKVGNCYYQAVGTSTGDKSFIGYAYMSSYVSPATMQDASAAFGNHFIRAGNQYMNISHWFTIGTEVIGGANEDIREVLASVANATLKTDNTTKRSVDANGNVEVIVQTDSGVGGSNYCPMRLVFSDGLLAYKVSSPNSTDMPRYQVCTSAENAVAGIFADLPFFTNRVLDSELYDRTTDLLSATFNYYEGADSIMETLKADFQRAFAGDLITLARMLVFIVLMWLVIASWVCYVCRLSNLTPWLEAIRYPAGERGGKGIDLMKIFSLGTISLDMEFNLGKFLQYEGILAVLLCVVMLSGRITIGG